MLSLNVSVLQQHVVPERVVLQQHVVPERVCSTAACCPWMCVICSTCAAPVLNYISLHAVNLSRATINIYLFIYLFIHLLYLKNPLFIN
jgi:hypothetical protein